MYWIPGGRGDKSPVRKGPVFTLLPSHITYYEVSIAETRTRSAGVGEGG